MDSIPALCWLRGNGFDCSYLNQALDTYNGLRIVALNINGTTNFLFRCCHTFMNTRNLDKFCLRVFPHHECENDVASHSVELLFSTASLEFVQIGKTSRLAAMLLPELQISNIPVELFL